MMMMMAIVNDSNQMKCKAKKQKQWRAEAEKRCGMKCSVTNTECDGSGAV